MSDDYTRQMIQWIMEQAAAGDPQQIPEYDIDPEDWVQDQARRMNLYQDTLNNQADMSVAAMAGPQAYAPGAFDPTYSYTPVEQPGTQALRAYAARPDTPEGIIAQGILDGSTAQAEIAKLQQAYAEAEANGTLEGSILEQIPMAPPNDMGEVLPDWEGLGFRMGDVEEAYFTEAQGGTSGALYDPVSGEFVGGGNRQTLLDENGQPVLADVETHMSDAAQWYANQGLSLPTDQFTAADLLDPSWQQQDQTAQQAMQDFLASGNALSQLYASLGSQPLTNKTPSGGTKGQPQAAPPSISPQDSWMAQYLAGTLDPLAGRNPTTLPGSSDANTLAQATAAATGPQTGRNPTTLPGSPAAAAAAEAQLANISGDGRNPSTLPGVDTQQLMPSGLIIGWSGGEPPEPAPPGAPTNNGGFIRNNGQQPAAYPVPVSEDAMDVLGLAGFAPNTSTRTGPEPSDTMAMLGHLLGISASNTSARTGPEPSEQASSSAGAPPGGYVHNGAIFDSQSRLVGYTSDGGGGRPSSTRTGPEPSEQVRIGEGRRGGGDQQVRIGQKSKASSVSMRRGGGGGGGYYKPSRPNTPATRAANEEFWTQSRNAGRAANATYGRDYGRALAAAYLLGQQGITPLSTQQSARRAASGPYGV